MFVGISASNGHRLGPDFSDDQYNGRRGRTSWSCRSVIVSIGIVLTFTTTWVSTGWRLPRRGAVARRYINVHVGAVFTCWA